MKVDPPSPAELEFIALLRKPAAYAAWAAEVRAAWAAARAKG